MERGRKLSILWGWSRTHKRKNLFKLHTCHIYLPRRLSASQLACIIKQVIFLYLWCFMVLKFGCILKQPVNAHVISLPLGSTPRPTRGIVKSVQQTWGISPGVGESCKTKSPGWSVFQQKISLPSPSHMRWKTFWALPGNDFNKLY